MEYCCSANLLHLVRRQDLVGKALLATQEKNFLADHGLRKSLYGNNRQDINQVLENIVYMELLRHGYDVSVGKVKNVGSDFCAEKSGKKCISRTVTCWQAMILYGGSSVLLR